MIRFINLTGQILIDDDEPHFAWFDTITDEFMGFNGSQDWHTWDEFKEDFLTDSKVLQYPLCNIYEELKRFKRLFQFKTSPTDSDQASKE